MRIYPITNSTMCHKILLRNPLVLKLPSVCGFGKQNPFTVHASFVPHSASVKQAFPKEFKICQMQIYWKLLN